MYEKSFVKGGSSGRGVRRNIEFYCTVDRDLIESLQLCFIRSLW